MTTTIGIALLIIGFIVLALLIYQLLDDWYRPLTLIPLLIVLFLFPVLSSSIMEDSQDCEYLVNETVQIGDTHTFDYVYECQEPSNATKSVYKITLRIIIALASLMLVFWGFSMLNNLGGKS